MLDRPESPRLKQALYRLRHSSNVAPNDHLLIHKFLKHWNHPVWLWLQRGASLSPSIDPVRELWNRASHFVPWYGWKFRLLGSMIMGSAQPSGILHQIYGV